MIKLVNYGVIIHVRETYMCMCLLADHMAGPPLQCVAIGLLRKVEADHEPRKGSQKMIKR